MRQRKSRSPVGRNEKKAGNCTGYAGQSCIIMVDEPTAGLDPEERIRFRGFIRRVAANRVYCCPLILLKTLKQLRWTGINK